MQAGARGVRIDYCTSIRMHAQVFALAGDYTDRVHHRIETETEFTAEYAQCKRPAAHLCGAAALGVDGVQAQTRAQAVKLPVGGTKVNAGETLLHKHQLLHALQTGVDVNQQQRTTGNARWF